MRKKHIMSYTAKELEEMRKAGQVGSDWTRASQSPVPDGGDPDDALEPVNASQARADMPIPRHIEVMTYLDPDNGDMWIARCPELPVTTEAKTYEELVSRVLEIAPEIAALNGVSANDGSIQLRFIRESDVPLIHQVRT